MLTLIRKELFKQLRQKSCISQTVMIIMCVAIVSLLTKYADLPTLTVERMGPNLFGTLGFIVFCLVYTASQTITMEFKYGTIKTIIALGYSRKQLLTSKIVVLFGYSIYLYSLALISSISVKLLLFSNISFSKVASSQHSLIESMLRNTIGSLLGAWLFISIVILLASTVKTGALAGMLGVIVYFFTSMLAGIQFFLIQNHSWLKWNPMNMVNLSNQISNHKAMSHLTLLSDNYLIFGNILYVILFLCLSYVFFNRKKV